MSLPFPILPEPNSRIQGCPPRGDYVINHVTSTTGQLDGSGQVTLRAPRAIANLFCAR